MLTVGGGCAEATPCFTPVDNNRSLHVGSALETAAEFGVPELIHIKGWNCSNRLSRCARQNSALTSSALTRKADIVSAAGHVG
jgi:hypothetical protein